jgi:hypothetical protein
VSTRTALDRVLSIDARPPLFGWAGVALSIHVGLASLLARKAIAAPTEPAITEIEFAPVETPPPPPPPPEQPVSEKTEEPTLAKAPTIAKAPPALGKAAPVLTAKTDEPAKADEPASFVTDPDGKEFGSGVVGQGGTADKGEKDGKPQVPSAPSIPTAKPLVAAAPTITPPANLSRPPKLESADPCRGFFPAGADDDKANVSVAVVVRPDGTVASANVVNETVTGQGFGKAARSCLLATKFSPALDISGHSTPAAATVIVRFAR